MDSIIETLKDLDRLQVIFDILYPAKKALSTVKTVTRRTAQPGDVAPIWQLRGETRRPERILQPVRREIKPQRHGCR